MESQDSLVDRNRKKFYETKKNVENRLQEHLSRSRNLLSQLYFGSDAYKQGFTAHGKANSSGQFSPQDYIPKPTASDEEDSTNVPSSYDEKRLFVENNLPSDGIHKTQATWLLQSSNVACNLPSSKVDDVKIPEILLTDPRDLLLGKYESVFKMDSNSDTLTQLLNSDGKLNKDDKRSLTSDNKNSNYIYGKSSFDIISTLDFAKVVRSRDTNEQALDQMLNEACKELESLACNVLDDPKSFNISDVDVKPENWMGESETTAGLDETLTKKFEENFERDFSKENNLLTQALFHISEQDKVREAEMAPKARIVREETEEEKEKEPEIEMQENKQLNWKNVSHGLETDLLGSFTIIKEGKLGRKMYRLSDFNRNYHGSTGLNTVSVETQTEIKGQTPAESSEKPIRPNVRVKYISTDAWQPSYLPEEKSIVKQEDLYAQQIIHNRHPNIGDGYAVTKVLKYRRERQDQEFANGEKLRISHARRDSIKKELMEKEKEEMKEWRLQKKQIYERMHLNRKSGMHGFMLCRGGKHRSSIVHSTNLIAKEEEFYESPSNKQGGNCYGYDDTDLLPEKNLIKYPKTPFKLPAEKDIPHSKKTLFNTISNFDQWWRTNTIKPNLTVNQLSL
ncbi:conserved hypothetical protein [Theileria equi strain WA]|uniref:Uncharacterized protein n=1 Tax=Theileria equi strain WA TaxID=1537102 RepID=L1LEN8_THEEQ|nr:conserved hypothetical protein [Theileria equi strain WA]EKX73791.1 conserved hypothetical protein [Theileria equi strain WA]|eukprot:XP_004833243.1 conserved hypothetical protein [Theileria equi strain WA]